MGIEFTCRVDMADPNSFFAKPKEQAVDEVMVEIDKIPIARCSMCGKQFNMTELDGLRRVGVNGDPICICSGGVDVLDPEEP